MPVLVIPPLASISPLECSDGVRPSHEAYAPAEVNRLKHPASAAGQKAVTASMPLMHESAPTTPAHRSERDSASTRLPRAHLPDSAQRTQVT